MEKVIFITIGQAPRKDLSETYDRYFKGNENVRQSGILDGLTVKEAEARYGAAETDEHTLTSVFTDGTAIVMERRKVERAVQQCIDRQQDADLICILCTGSFETLHAEQGTLIEAETITVAESKALFQNKRIGVFVPLPQQIPDAMEKWEIKDRALFRAASPYHFDKDTFKRAAAELAAEQAEVIILDCMGYNEKMKRYLESVAPGVTIVQSNALLFQHIAKKIN